MTAICIISRNWRKNVYFREWGPRIIAVRDIYFLGARVLCEAGSSVRGCVGTGVVVRDRV